MKDIKIIIVTLPNGFFGSAGQSWQSIDVKEISRNFCNLGFPVITTTIEKVLSEVELNTCDFVIYTSSENGVMRQYVKDIMYLVGQKSCIVPNYDLLMAHENKGFQELLRADKEFGDLNGCYNVDHLQLPHNYPYVYKGVAGAGSSDVELIKSKRNRDKVLFYKEFSGFRRLVINFMRWVKLSEDEYRIYKYNKKKFSAYIVQDFVSSLEFDYKVLVFWDKFFVLKRNIRKGDFRASGSGLFEFEKPSDEVLNYAKNIFEKLDTPYASLDIVLLDGACKLIEFQSLNFGPYTLNNAPGFYFLDGGEWTYVEGRASLDNEFSRSLTLFVKETLSKSQN